MSENGNYALVFQASDRNVVLYKKETQGGKDYGVAIWASQTERSNGSSLNMMPNGNLVLKGTNWDSGTAGNDGAYLNVQDSGDAKILNQDGKPIATTDTKGGHRSAHFGSFRK